MSESELTGFNAQAAKGYAVSESYSQIHAAALDAAAAALGDPMPPLEMMRVIGSPNEGHFRSVLTSQFVEIVSRCRVIPSASVLDIGCGVGRLSLPFAHYLSEEGSFTGIDVWDEGITWCVENIHATQGAPFNFQCVVASDNYYFQDAPNGESNEFSLNFIPDSSIDFAYAISTFTHLRMVDVAQYLQALGRILRPDGLAYVTGFVIDRYFHHEVARTGRFAEAQEEFPGQYYGYSGQDYFAGFDMAKWQSMFAQAGLYAQTVETGSWVDKPGSQRYQDLFILGRVTS